MGEVDRVAKSMNKDLERQFDRAMISIYERALIEENEMGKWGQACNVVILDNLRVPFNESSQFFFL